MRVHMYMSYKYVYIYKKLINICITYKTSVFQVHIEVTSYVDILRLSYVVFPRFVNSSSVTGSIVRYRDNSQDIKKDLEHQ